jgi:hypothetical protein
MGWEGVADFAVRILSYLGVMVSSLAAMTLLTAAAPGFVRREREAARRGMRQCFLWGSVFVTNVVLVAALLALADGVIGRVLALALMVGLLVVGLAGQAAITIEVGRRVLTLGERDEASVLLRLTTGTVILFFTAVIPVFGWLVFTSALLVGIGAFLETAVEDYRPTSRRVGSAVVAPDSAQ